MTPDELRAIMEFLKAAGPSEGPGPRRRSGRRIRRPDGRRDGRTGLDREACRQILDAPWWDEMVADIVETPEMCDPEIRPSRCSSTPGTSSRSTFASGRNSRYRMILRICFWCLRSPSWGSATSSGAGRSGGSGAGRRDLCRAALRPRRALLRQFRLLLLRSRARRPIRKAGGSAG